MRRHRLSRQIVLSMSAVSAIAALIVFVGFFLFYAIFLTWHPPPPGPPPILPQAPDLILIAVFLLLGLIIAIFVALRLTRRIVAPLNSLAEGARKIAAGDLSARAAPGDRSLGETAQLVDDFNEMARRLENTAEVVRSGNAAIAHEFRTPLTILRGRLQGLAEGVFEPSDELFRNLLSQVEGLTRLVEDLRVITLSDNNRLEVRMERTDLAAQALQTVEAMRPALVEAGFRVELRTRPVSLRCDGFRLRQALMALLENARRHATPGRLEISMRTEDGCVVLAVEDEGPGMAPDFAPHAFDPFTRLEPSRSRQYGGSGLGLAVVRVVAEAHNGAARHRPAPGGGSIFEISLPLENADGHEEEAP